MTASSRRFQRAKTRPPVATTGFPDATNTGWQPTGVTLSTYTGPMTIDTDGTIIDGKDINGSLYIIANNVTIRRCRIRSASGSPTQGGNMIVQQSNYYTPSITGLTIQDTEITRPTGNNGGADYAFQMYGKNVTFTRVNIWNVTSGVHLGGDGFTIQDSFIHDLVDISGQDHNDGILANGGAPNVNILHNTIEVPLNQVSPIALYPEGSPNSYWVINNNLLAGGGNCIYPSYTKGSEQPNHHIQVTNNHFSRKFFPNGGANGPVNGGQNGANFFDGAGNVWTGNIWHDTGLPVNP